MRNWNEQRNQEYKLPESVYWRYKKHKPPEEAFPGKNGPVIVKKRANMEPSITVTRLEIIDHTLPAGDRAYVKWETKPFEVTLSIQDDGRTLKIFLEPGDVTEEKP